MSGFSPKQGGLADWDCEFQLEIWELIPKNRSAVHFRVLAIALCLLLILDPVPAWACLWDRDTLRYEAENTRWREK